MLNGAKDSGISVPENLSIVIIDWTELTQSTRPILTAAQQNFAQMSELAIKSHIHHRIP
ncbi:substrate-binding domain-containing protein [Leuconostoc citreum]